MNIETHNVINRLKDLIQKDGVFYALLFSLFEDSCIRISQIENFDPNQKISSSEASWIIGFMIQCNSSFLTTFPKNLFDFIELGEELHDVLKELEYSYVKSYSVLDEDRHSPDNLIATLSVATHYDGNSAYDYEYADFSIPRYARISKWLKENRNINITDCTNIAKRIKTVLQNKTYRVHLFSEEESKLFYGHEPSKEEMARLRLSQFVELFDEDINSEEDEIRQEAIKRFSLRLLDLFCFSTKDLDREISYEAFLKHFTLDITKDVVTNTKFDQPGKYNLLDSNPIIKVSENKYFVPYMLNVFKAIYETPYYWWMQANNWSKEAGDVLGNSNEEIVYNLLNKVFCNNQCWQGVVLQKGKKQITDIDVLCIVGTKAICVQVKSKKLSEKSKTGEYDAIIRDFNQSVIASYKQAERCKQYLKFPDIKFFQKDNQQIELPIKEIKDIYLMCVLCGEYDGLAHHVDYLFNPQENDSLPLVCSVFDLHLMTDYLSNPYDFTYYVKQRIETWKFFKFTNEISVLGYHLKNNLHHLDNYNYALIDNDYARMIDKDYMLYMYGINDKLHLKLMWQSGFIEQFCTLLHQPKFIEVLFFINDFCTDTREQFEEKVRDCIERSSNNHSIASMILTVDEASTGLIVCASSEEYPIETIREHSEFLANKYAKQFSYRHDIWYIIGISSSKAEVFFVNVLNKV